MRRPLPGWTLAMRWTRARCGSLSFAMPFHSTTTCRVLMAILYSRGTFAKTGLGQTSKGFVKKRETFLQAQQQGGKPKPTASAGQNAELISLAKIDQGSERMLRGMRKRSVSSHFSIKRSYYQDRLGTTIGNRQKRLDFSHRVFQGVQRSGANEHFIHFDASKLD